ncbi:MAG: hypothetical protein PHG00_03205 [Methylococcales bacterium]|nr:hypothetical protein [Methylococcales bacterium]
MLLSWIRKKTEFELNAKAIDCNQFYIGFDCALSAETISMLSRQNAMDQDINIKDNSDKIKLILDEYELALS